MTLLTVGLLAQLAVGSQPALPMLSFPEPGIDDSASYQGYETRFFRDAARNTLQIYIERNAGRVVHLWANADNESMGFTARDHLGAPAALEWASPGATVADSAGARSVQYALSVDAAHIHLGWFLLGSMRVERDFQHEGRHKAPFGGPPYSLREVDRLVGALERLEPRERRRHLTLLRAADVRTLRQRMRPRITTLTRDSVWIARVIQPALDGLDTLVLEIHADLRRVIATRAGDSLSLQARQGDRLTFGVRISSSATPLTPLAREEIFTPEFLAFLERAKANAAAVPRGATGSGTSDSAAVRSRWLERQVRAVELLSSREKLMAGLPTYGTYFGRDMLVSALMMRPIWRDEMSEFVLASVLRKLSPTGEVSHEEALGGQAVREAAAAYASLLEARAIAIRGGRRAAADSLLRSARETLRDIRRVRENYHMIDDELQFAVLAARWLGDPAVDRARKRAFLMDSSDNAEPRLHRLLRAIGVVARMTAAYSAQPNVGNLISFAPRESSWAATSWRDSNAGYAGGRYAMDVNALWAPHALEAVAQVLMALREIGFSTDSLARTSREVAADTLLSSYMRNPGRVRQAAAAWSGASRHFELRLGPAEVRSHVAARLAAMPAEEGAYWTARMASSGTTEDSLTFLALALDAAGKPIGVANTDVATRLFLGELRTSDRPGPRAVREAVLRDVRLFVRPYPSGLFIDRVGPVVANDAYATPAIWQRFERDPYHGPRVVWGREVNLFLLGVASSMREPEMEADRAELRAALRRTLDAVAASGFQSELWSYEIRDGRLTPVRYGTSSDIQLWSTTDLAVQFELSRLPP